jgi:TPR repeat protein
MQAAHWFRLAANQGNAGAKRRLGSCYLNGQGVPQDPTMAFRLFQESAKAGDKDGQYWLGVCYARGDGVAPDEDNAILWLKKSEAAGNPHAKAALADISAHKLSSLSDFGK